MQSDRINTFNIYESVSVALNFMVKINTDPKTRLIFL